MDGVFQENNGAPSSGLNMYTTNMLRFCGDSCIYSAQADWTLTHTSHKDTEQSTIEASITLDGVTLTDSLTR
jgi:hypothetical protein